MNKETPKNLKPVRDSRNTSPSDGIPKEAELLHFCLDHEGLPFAFVYNGIPLGDQITIDSPNLPKSMYEGFVFFQNSFHSNEN